MNASTTTTVVDQMGGTLSLGTRPTRAPWPCERWHCTALWACKGRTNCEEGEEKERGQGIYVHLFRGDFFQYLFLVIAEKSLIM